jgi:heme O synthase-like polyprenyltransferase
MKLFGFSITYLTALFALMLADHYLPLGSVPAVVG